MPRSPAPFVREPSSRQLIDDWLGLRRLSPLEADTVLRLEGTLADAESWRRFLLRLTRWAGVIACAAALVFFIAFNWQELPRVAKFAVLQAALAACALTAWWRGASAPTRQAALVGAMLVCGVLLAFVGQTYQTGADPWQLFLSWALLILPWVIAARLTLVWTGWLLLMNLAVSLYLGRAAGFADTVFDSAVGPIPLFWLNAVAWAAGRWLLRGSASRGITRGAAALTLAHASLLLIAWVFVGQEGVTSMWEWVSRVAALGTFPVLLTLYTRSRDAAVLSLACLGLIACSLAWVIHTANSQMRADHNTFWVAGAYLILSSALAAAWLRNTVRNWRTASS